MKRFDIFYCDLGHNIGSEQNGIRPCIVIQNDLGNIHSPTTIIIPLTSKIKKHKLPTHVVIEGMLDKPSVALCEQIRVIDKSRLQSKISILPIQFQKKVEQAIAISLGLH